MEFISEGIFEKYSKMKILVFEIFEKGQILMPFSGLAPSKLKTLMVAYVHIEYSTYQFSEESKGGPERVYIESIHTNITLLKCSFTSKNMILYFLLVTYSVYKNYVILNVLNGFKIEKKYIRNLIIIFIYILFHIYKTRTTCP